MSGQKDADSGGFSADERAAMKERAKELKAEAKASRNREAGEKDLFAKVEEMAGADKEMALRLHEIMTDVAPELFPKTWYGMPAYTRDGKIICFFQAASKFGARYATFGFQEDANLDDGNMWPTSFALTKLGSKEEATIRKLVKQALA